GSPLPSPKARSAAAPLSLSRDNSQSFEFDGAPEPESPMRLSLCSRLSTATGPELLPPRMSQIMEAFAVDSSACSTPTSSTAGKRGFHDWDADNLDVIGALSDTSSSEAALEPPLPPPKLLTRA